MDGKGSTDDAANFSCVSVSPLSWEDEALGRSG